jgi:hypothetical protein
MAIQGIDRQATGKSKCASTGYNYNVYASKYFFCELN